MTYVTTATPDDLAVLKKRGIDVASTSEQPLAPAILEAAKPHEVPDVAGVDRQETTGSLGSRRQGRAAVAKPLNPNSLKLRPALGDS